MTKKEKKRLAVAKIAREKGVSLKVAAHIYACWPSLKQRHAREAAVRNILPYKIKSGN